VCFGAHGFGPGLCLLWLCSSFFQPKRGGGPEGERRASFLGNWRGCEDVARVRRQIRWSRPPPHVEERAACSRATARLLACCLVGVGRITIFVTGCRGEATGSTLDIWAVRKRDSEAREARSSSIAIDLGSTAEFSFFCSRGRMQTRRAVDRRGKGSRATGSSDPFTSVPDARRRGGIFPRWHRGVRLVECGPCKPERSPSR